MSSQAADEDREGDEQQSAAAVLTLASLTLTVLVYALVPHSRGTRWLGQSDVALAMAEALKQSADDEESRSG